MSSQPVDFSDIWQELEADLRSGGVKCWQSGACCNFHEFDHDVFATTAELAALVAHKTADHQGVAEGLCPYWHERRCTAHQARPLSCRVYHCNHQFQEEQQGPLYEKYLAKIQARIAESGDAYSYVHMLRWLKSQG